MFSKDAARYVRAASRLAGRAAGRNRYVRATWAGMSVTMRSYGRIFHMLFLEVTGLLFLFFALVGSIAIFREYRAWQTGKEGYGRLLLAVAFGVMFLWFAATSFRRARKKPQPS